MTMIATDELTDGQLIDLPPEAGDANQPWFEPIDDWLRSAPRAAQKTAMWRWFATRYEELESSTPHDPDGTYFFGTKEPPAKADEVLRSRFAHLVPRDVLDELITGLQSRAGNLWSEVELDKLSS
jgi:hypothetical protein